MHEKTYSFAVFPALAPDILSLINRFAYGWVPAEWCKVESTWCVLARRSSSRLSLHSRLLRNEASPKKREHKCQLRPSQRRQDGNSLLWDISGAKAKRERFLWRHVERKSFYSWSTSEGQARRYNRPSPATLSATGRASLVRSIRSAIESKILTFCHRTSLSRWTLTSWALTRYCCCSWTDPSVAFVGSASDTSSLESHAHTTPVLCSPVAYLPCRNRESDSFETADDGTRLWTGKKKKIQNVNKTISFKNESKKFAFQFAAEVSVNERQQIH